MDTQDVQGLERVGRSRTSQEANLSVFKSCVIGVGGSDRARVTCWQR